MAYTAPTLKTNTNDFGPLANDGNRNAMTGALGNYMQSQDATGTAVASPVTLDGTTQTLNVPANAVQVTFIANTAVCQISEDSSMTAFFTIPVDTPVTIDCARLSKIYVKGTSTDKLQFYFNMV